MTNHDQKHENSINSGIIFIGRNAEFELSDYKMNKTEKTNVVPPQPKHVRLSKIKKGENLLKIIWFFFGRFKLPFFFLIVLATLIGILEALNVAIMTPILAGGLGLNTPDNLFLNFIDRFTHFIPINDKLVLYCVLFIMLACTVLMTKIVYIFFSTKLTSKIVIQTKQDIFNKCINSDYQFFIDNKQGEILYKTSTAPSNVALLIGILSQSVIEIVLSVSVFALLLSMSLKGTVLILAGGIGYYYLTKYLSTKIAYKAGRQKYQSGQTEMVIVNEFTEGIKQIKVFQTFPYWKNLFDKTLHTYWRHSRKSSFWTQVPEILLFFLVYISIGGAVIFIKLQYPGNFGNTLPIIGTFAFAVFLIMPKLSKLGNYRMLMMDVLPSATAIFEMLKDTTYGKIKNGNKEFTGLNSSIELRNVKFAYKDRDILLDNVSLKIKKDKITALVGPSGSGKSTVVNLLLRLHDVGDGGVYIDDTNIKEFDIFSFLKKVGYVSQETFIYNASVKDNIAFGDTYTEQEIIEAARLANADEFIQQLPEKYDTIVGDRGMKISGGEKQRIAIARAMIRKPEILILDEATSSLDNISENIVQKAINKISKNCTTLIIAHRLSTIQNADIIYVIDQGKIIESGMHSQLLKQKSKYWELYNIQKN
jgi:ABC-type multidrug transport system fused ATPase/permease subunit